MHATVQLPAPALPFINTVFNMMIYFACSGLYWRTVARLADPVQSLLHFYDQGICLGELRPHVLVTRSVLKTALAFDVLDCCNYFRRGGRD